MENISVLHLSRGSAVTKGTPMRLHHYSAGALAAVTHADVSPEVRLVDVIAVEVDEHVYRVGAREEIDVCLTLVEIFGEEHGRIVTHPCGTIDVRVDYAGQQAELVGHVGELSEVVRNHAIKQLRIEPSVAADLALRQVGSSEDVPPTAPLGSLVPKGTCAVVLDLVHAVRPQG